MRGIKNNRSGPRPARVIINIHDERWNSVKIDYEKIFEKALILVNADVEVSVTLTNDDEIRALNGRYRDQDKPTNVLSFELGPDLLDAVKSEGDGPCLLGDIFISIDTAIREADAENKTLVDHVTHLLVHGALHLTGFDHMNDADAEKMESREIEILKKMGIDNPYALSLRGGRLRPTRQSSGSRANHTVDGVGLTGLPRSFHSLAMTKIMKTIFFIALGMAASYGFAPYYFWPITLLSIGIMYYVMGSKKVTAAGPACWGAGYGIMSFSWALSSIAANDELFRRFWWFYPFGFLFIGIGSGLVFALPFWMSKGYFGARRVVAFGLAWTFVLWLREWLLTGFPWNPLANIWINYSIGQIMGIIGALGLTFITVGAIAATVEFIKSRGRIKWPLLFCMPLLMSVIFWPTDDIEYSDTGVRIVQPAFDMNMKVNNHAAAEHIIEKLIELSNAGPLEDIDLVIWPETTYPYAITSYVKLPTLGVPLVTGTIYIDGDKTYNAMVLTDNEGRIVDKFLKFHLVPFGEYSPFNILPTPANLSRGPGPKLINNFVPSICYDIIFSDSLIPKELNAKRTAPGRARSDALMPRGMAPEFILNITNDAWFGKLSGPYQHLDMARRQAIETGLPVVRANYGGISAVIAPDGRVLQSLDIGVRGTIDANVPVPRMIIYHRIGLNGIMLIIILLSAPFLIYKRKK